MGLQFETVYKENQERVYRICLGYVKGNSELAKDLTQEVFLKIWEHLHNFRGESKISTWIYRITVNTCLMQLRNNKYVDLQPLPKNVAEDQSTNNENRFDRMYGCINKLRKEDKALILLDLEDVPQKRIAEIVGISHEALRVRLHRIKKSLTQCVQHGNI